MMMMKKLLPALSAVSAVSAAIALGAALPAAAQQPPAAAAAPASAASAPAFSVRPEVGKALNEAVDLYRAGKVADAKAKVEQTQAATAQPQPAELTVMHRLRGLFALQLEQTAEGIQQLEAALAINAQPPTETLSCKEALARGHFNAKAYPKAADWARQAIADGSKSAAVQSVLVRATYLQNDYAGAVKLLEAQAQRDGKLNVEDLRLLASAYGQLKDEANYVRLIEVLLREHGRSEYWPDLVSRVQRAGNWQTRWDIDAYRLRMQLDLMEEADDYLVLADLAAKAGLPAEAQKVLEAGFAKGLLGKGAKAGEQEKFRAAMVKAANDDRATLAAAAARPPAVGDARAAAGTFNTGAALAGAGQAERGLELMKAALAGPLPDPAQARLQYGEALLRAGRNAEAAEQFKMLADHPALGLLARLWQQAATAPRKG
jgi:hypothetical protein